MQLANHTFKSGDSLDYDVSYVSGSRNRTMAIYFNGQALDRYLGYGLGQHWAGSIGHNNQDFDIGNQLGRYHINLQFLNDGFNLDVNRPDGSLYQKNVPVSASEFTMGFETWSNGSIQAEYDNFTISNVPEPSTTAVLFGAGALGVAGLLNGRKKE